MKLWPRLPLARAAEFVASLPDLSPEALEARWQAPEVRVFAATGGVRVTDAALRGLRSGILSAARDCGFPTVTRGQRGEFDRLAGLLLSEVGIPTGEGLRPEVWAWIATLLLPDVTRWRWERPDGQVGLERFAGSVYRNAFGRLWLSVVTLDRGPSHHDRWGVLNTLGADQMVALLERPTIAGNPDLGRAIGEAWYALRPQDRTEDLFREAMKALLVQMGVRRLDVLDQKELQRHLHRIFESTGLALGMGPLGRD